MEEIGVGLIVVLVIIGLIELGLVIWALIDIIRRPTTSALPRWAWAIIVIVFNVLGPILYLAIGRRSDTTVDRYANDPIVPPRNLQPQTPDYVRSQPHATPAPEGGAPTVGASGAAGADSGVAGAGGGTAAPLAPQAPAAPAPEAPTAPGAADPGVSRADQAIDTLYGRDRSGAPETTDDPSGSEKPNG
jgi:hypothetical protein